MDNIAIYILMEHIMPIPIAVEGFYPIVINPEIKKHDERTYINLYDYINVSLKDNKCNRFNAMYYLCQKNNLPQWVGICPQNKYFCFQDDIVKNDGSKRGANFAEIIAPIGAEERLKFCDILFAEPLDMGSTILCGASMDRVKAKAYFYFYKAICEVLPSYESSFIEFILNKKFIESKMFVTSRELFKAYVNITALIINRLKRDNDFLALAVSFDQVAEIMLNIFAMNRKIKIETCPVMNFSFREQKYS